MRSLGFTLILALLAMLCGGIATWQWLAGNFNSILGAPPIQVGGRIYNNFSPADVKFIRVSQNGTTASFELGPGGWQATIPWADRMDPRAAVSIINFTLAMRVEDVAPIDKVDSQKAGLRESGINIRLEGTNQTPLAKYKLGRQTPWLATVPDMVEPVPTVFVQPRDLHRKSHIYACTGDIIPLFKDNLKFLRDHRPFYFNPTALKQIRIRATEGELTLARLDDKSPWRVSKPLDLATNRAAMKTLMENLFELQALRISDRASITLPATGTPGSTRQIALTEFGSDSETVLEIYPPETPEAAEVLASVSNRPNTIFSLPLKPEADLISLADLPLAINDLRDATLTHLNLKTLRRIHIQPANGSEIVILRTPPRPWVATIDGRSQDANEERLFALLKTATEGTVVGFETDAATDFTPWGLDRPILKLRFTGEIESQFIELAFGIDSKGDYFVNRTGTPTVMRVERSLVDSIPRRTYEWRHSRLWSIDRFNLIAIERKQGAESPLLLRYVSDSDEWTASRDGVDITANLNPQRANYLLDTLEGLKVSRWLPHDDPSALEAIANPSLTLKIIEKSKDNTDDLTGFITREIVLAPGSNVANPGFYYGRIASTTHPFLMDRETYDKLVTTLLENP